MASPDYVIVTARDEAARLPATLAALARAFPQAHVLVADDGSRDATAVAAAQGGAQVVAAGRRLGKGGAATLAARRVLAQGASGGAVVLLCDADLGETAGRLGGLVEQLEEDHADVAVAAFAARVGGGFGVALGFAGWALRRRTGLALRAPISGQRAVRARDLPRLLPFAPRFGMELGMTIDAARAGLRVGEVELDLEHRATGRSAGGFGHRARQLGDFLLMYLAWGRLDLLSKRLR
jgi:glycosyltransferase involved in cell wall biosynthesis